MTLQDICDDADFLVGTNSTSYPVAAKVRNGNLRYLEATALILKSDGRWQWDDNNQTDLPIGTATLVEGQPDYGINGLDFLTISSSRVKDSNGVFHRLEVVDGTDPEFQRLSAVSGLPRMVAKRGSSLLLAPLPTAAAVTLSAGLEVAFQRPPLAFSSDALTVKPGFSPLHHRFISLGISIDYAVAKGLRQKLAMLTPLMAEQKQGLMDTYNRRPRDEQPRLVGDSDGHTEKY